MNLSELQLSLEDVRAKMLSLVEEAEGEDRDLTDEEKSQYDDLNERRERLKNRIERASEVKQEDRSEKRDAVRKEYTSMEVSGPQFEKDKARGFETPREFITSVIDAGRGKRTDERLMSLRAAGSDEQSTFSDGKGGFLVPDAFSPDVLQLEPESDPIAGRTRRIPMNSQTVKIPARVDKDHSSSVSGGLTVTRKEEAIAGTSSTMDFEQVALQAYSLFGLSYVTEELLQDSPQSFAALLEQGFRQEFTSHIIDERLNGTGVGEYEGVMNSPALVSVAKEGSQAADTIVYNNVLKMRSRCWGYQNAIWLANHDTFPQLAILEDAGNNNVYMPSAREDRPDLLLGRPIFYTEYTQTLGDLGDIVLVNFTEYLEGILQPLQGAESIHVRFVEHQRTFKFWLRNAGTGWWKTALTPKNSTTTLSPFVALAERA